MPLVGHAQSALLLSVLLVLPVLAAAALVGVVVAAFQAASQVQDATMAHAPRMIAVVAALVVVGPWMGREIASFATQMFRLAAL
ncbi:MAG: flagellar biosynthetic protein FliQ [Polyangiaceae bacterium]